MISLGIPFVLLALPWEQVILTPGTERLSPGLYRERFSWQSDTQYLFSCIQKQPLNLSSFLLGRPRSFLTLASPSLAPSTSVQHEEKAPVHHLHF